MKRDPWTDKQKAIAAKIAERNTDEGGQLLRAAVLQDPLITKIKRTPTAVLAWICNEKYRAIAKRKARAPIATTWTRKQSLPNGNGDTTYPREINSEPKAHAPAAALTLQFPCPRCGCNMKVVATSTSHFELE